MKLQQKYKQREEDSGDGTGSNDADANDIVPGKGQDQVSDIRNALSVVVEDGEEEEEEEEDEDGGEAFTDLAETFVKLLSVGIGSDNSEDGNDNNDNVEIVGQNMLLPLSRYLKSSDASGVNDALYEQSTTPASGPGLIPPRATDIDLSNLNTQTRGNGRRRGRRPRNIQLPVQSAGEPNSDRADLLKKAVTPLADCDSLLPSLRKI